MLLITFVTFIVTAGAAKILWEKLRRCFLNALSRRRNKKSGDPGKQISPWKYEAQMSFLLPFLDSRGTASNIAGNADDAEIDQDLNNSQENVADEDEADGGADENTEIATVSIRDSETPSRSQSFKKSKRVTSQDSLTEMVTVLKDNASLRKRKFEEREKRSDVTMPCIDETDMFFMSMSKMTETLPFIEQAKLKKLLSNAVLDAQIAISQNNQNQQSSVSTFSSPTYSEGPSPSPVYSEYLLVGSTYNYTPQTATGSSEDRPTLLELPVVPMCSGNINM